MTFWTEQTEKALRTLWGEGLSASAIASRLSRIHPLGLCTNRNAVIGKAHRLGLAERPSPIKRPPPPVEFDSRACEWPNGDPGQPDFHFCGKPRQSGKPYCAKHCKKAYAGYSHKKGKPNPFHGMGKL